MIIVYRANQRRHERGRSRECWRTFGPRAISSPFADGPGGLRQLIETRLGPGGATPRCAQADTESITYVLQGSLGCDDSTGSLGMLRAGEFRRATGSCGKHRTQRNASLSEPAHVIQLWLRSPDAAADPGEEQKRFSAAERRGALCLVASCDARVGSLRLRTDALVYSALLERGHHIAYDLAPQRRAWFQLLAGEVTLEGMALLAGDGVAITAQRPLSFIALIKTEILLIDMGEGRVAH